MLCRTLALMVELFVALCRKQLALYSVESCVKAATLVTTQDIPC